MSSAARIEELQKKFDENPRRYFAPLANECRKAGELDAAIAICRAHLPQQPGHMSGHIVYGQALYESGELAEAKSVFETALALDPENLIALRHMGDIAARGGDASEARQWYKRVLETDPRNEEIQALLAEMSGGSASVDARDTPGGETVEGLPSLLDPELLAAAAEAGLPAEQASDASLESQTEPLLMPTALGGDTGGAHEGSGNLDGFEATSFEAPSVEAPEPEPVPAPPSVAERAADPELLTFEMPALEPPHGGSAAPPVAGFDATGIGATGLEVIGESFAATAEESSDAPRMAMDVSGASPAQDPPSVDDAFVTETMAELYVSQGYHDRALEVYRQLVAQHPDDAELRSRMEQAADARAAASEDAADTGPSDSDHDFDHDFAPASAPGLPTALEPALVAAAADASDAAAGMGWDAGDAPTGPTIRDFLTALAHGQALGAVERGAEVADAPTEAFAEPLPDPAPFPDPVPISGEVAGVVEPAAVRGPLSGIPLMEWDDASLEAPVEAPPVGATPEPPAPMTEPARTPEPAGAVGSGLDRLFGAAANALDVRAADILSSAFAPPTGASPEGDPVAAEVNPLSGKPARPAGNDLSLDSVFGGSRQPGSGRSTGGFSFDQFFSDGAVKAPREESHEPTAAEGDSEDLEQFNSWLHGLKNQ